MDLVIQEELSTIVATGVFGKNVTNVSFKLNTDKNGRDQFMSEVIFGTIIISDDSNYQILVKFKPRDPEYRRSTNIDTQFQNEISTYKKIMPFLLACQSSNAHFKQIPTIPRYLYGRNQCGNSAENDLIMFEDANYLGFYLTENYPFLDYDHLKTAIQSLAKLHALSYVAKSVDPDGFRDAIAGVGDILWKPDGTLLYNDYPLTKTGGMGLELLLERDGDRYRDDAHVRRFRELIADENDTLRRALEPREPLAVVCHGDFNRNNLLFRYDGRGRVDDVMPIDFARIRYGSPALDLSFFVYMNTSRATRDRWYGDLLDEYCATLAAAVPDRYGFRVPGRAELDAEMAASALFGFKNAAFFLPWLFQTGHVNPDRDRDWDVCPDVWTDGFGAELVADMVQHIVDMGYTPRP